MAPRAAKEGFGELDRGEGIEFASIDDVCACIDEIDEDVSAELAAERESAWASSKSRSRRSPGYPREARST